MSLTLTLGLIAAVLAFTAFAGWRGAQPLNVLKGPRMAPWRFLMLMGAAVLMLLLIHLATLLGAERPAWVSL
ncbi:MAG: hypothetical protein EON96_17120 [Caulobacteraceae bacterium]|nr:MAG: hypothetical protein EON96_17120 [Caulobacteraceae bacterium]